MLMFHFCSFGCNSYRNTNRYTRPALRSRNIRLHRWIGRLQGGNVNQTTTKRKQRGAVFHSLKLGL